MEASGISSRGRAGVRLSVCVYVAGAAKAQAAEATLAAAWPVPEQATGAEASAAELRVVDVRADMEAAEAARVLVTPMMEVRVLNRDGTVLMTRRFVGGIGEPEELRGAVHAFTGLHHELASR